MQSRLSDPKTVKFRSDLGFNQINVILKKKEQSVVIPSLKAFSAEKIKLQHKALKNERLRTDMYFSEHKFAVEINVKGHIYIKMKKTKFKQKQKNILTINFFTGLILMQQVLIFFLKLVKYNCSIK